MTGAEINSKLARGLRGKFEICEFFASPGFSDIQAPSDSMYSMGVVDSVTRQANRVDAVWDKKHKRLTIRRNCTGPGYWIPYLGNGPKHPIGMAQTPGRGLGTYTPPVILGGPISWVVTGPFSGCTAASFSPGGGKVFAHVITPADGSTADTVSNQISNIATRVGAPIPGPDVATKILSGVGEGFVFWLLINGVWYRRIMWAYAGIVKGMERKTQV